MTFEEIIAIADAHYPDGLVRYCFEYRDGSGGDSLAQFVVNELEGLAGTGDDDVDELNEAAHRIDRAIVELVAVANGLLDEANRREGARIKARLKVRAKTTGEAPAPGPNTFKRGDYVQTTSWRTTSYGRVICIRPTYGLSAPNTIVQLHCIEWADRTRSIEVVDDHEPDQQNPLSLATEAQFDAARREYDRLVTALQPGAKFIMHDSMTQGFLVVQQAPMPGVLTNAAAWVGRYVFPMGDSSTVEPPGTRKPPDNARFVVAREIDRDKLRAVRVEPGFIEACPSALVAGPFRESPSQKP